MSLPAKVARPGRDTATKRLEAIEKDLAAVVIKLDKAVLDLKVCVADNESGREILAIMNDQYLQDRAWRWTRVAVLAAAATYQQWFPVLWKVIHG